MEVRFELITEQQYRRLKMSIGDMALYQAADRAKMTEKTARKYIRAGKGPGEVQIKHSWATRENPYEEIWPEIKKMLEINGGLDGTTIFNWLNEKYKGRFQEGQLRSLQRLVKKWRATEGPSKEIMFPQEHKAGILSESDFTDMNELEVKINGELFKHKLYHFVLTYSNWETANICFSESFETLSEGFQMAIWELGRVPAEHQTDQMSSAVQKVDNRKEFTQRYQHLLDHYGIKGKKIQAGEAHENGDVEQANYRLKKAIRQAMLLRGSTNFSSRLEYEEIIKRIIKQLNLTRQTKFKEELRIMNPLPLSKIDSAKYYKLTVRPSSTINIDRNVYSVDSRLIGEKIEIKVTSNKLEIWYGQKKVSEIEREKGRYNEHINYRHIIDSLVRKPGAFENYKYKEALFPTSRFRFAYDWLCKYKAGSSSKEYLKILYLAAKTNESKVDSAISWLFTQDMPIDYEFVEDLVKNADDLPVIQKIKVDEVKLETYDQLLTEVLA